MFNWNKKEAPLKALAGMGGGVGRGGGGATDALPLYDSQGASSYTTNAKSGTRNAGTSIEVDYYLGTSNTVGFNNTTPASDSHNYYTTRSSGKGWYLAANFSGTSSGNLTRWGARNQINFEHSILSYTTSDGSSITATNKRTSGSGQITGTGANIIQTGYGNFEYDAVTFNNGAGNGFANWYADSNGSYQKYPGIISAIHNAYDGSKQITKFDNVSQGDSNGGGVWWRPPEKTSEVFMDFANSHSNGRCSLTCWDDNSGQMVWTIQYGRFATVDAGNSLGDSASRSIIATHQDGFVYFNIDHAGTIAGSHYYLYR